MIGQTPSVSRHGHSGSGVAAYVRSLLTGRSRRVSASVSVSALAFMIASAGVVRADDAAPVSLVSQVDGQDVTLKIPEDSSRTYVFGGMGNNYAGLTESDYNKLTQAGLLSTKADSSFADVTAQSLFIEGSRSQGGVIQVGATGTDFSAKTLTFIKIENGGTLATDNSTLINQNVQNGRTPASLIEGADGTVQPKIDMNLSKNNSTLSIYNTHDNIYNVLKSVHGEGTISISNVLQTSSKVEPNTSKGSVLKIFDSDKSASGSYFSGTILGSGGGLGDAGSVSLLMKNEPNMNQSGSLSQGAPFWTSQLLLGSVFTELNKATVTNIGTMEISAAGDFGDKKTVTRDSGHVLIHGPSIINVGELLVAGGRDGFVYRTQTAEESRNVKSVNADLVISDARANVRVAQLVVGQQYGVKRGDISNASDWHVDYGASVGEVWLANGASLTVTGGGVNGGIYLGNSAGNGPDQRTANGQSNPYPEEGEAHGTLHITGDAVGYDSSRKINRTEGRGAQSTLTVKQGALWIGPVDGGQGSGEIDVDKGGRLNLNNSFIVLGGANGAGNVAIGDGGTLNVTGMDPAGLTAENQGATFSQERKGSLTLAKGGTLNIGNSGAAGLLKLYGDLNLEKGSTTTFYEGTTTDKGNFGDAYNSHIFVAGNVNLGSTIQIAGIAGQNKGENGAVDVGLYHLIDYTGLLQGERPSVLATSAGQEFRYVYDDSAKKIDAVISSPHWERPPSWEWGDANWTEKGVTDGTPFRLETAPIFTGPGGTITITRDNLPRVTSNIDFEKSGYTIQGGPLAAAPGNNGQNTLAINTASQQSGTIASTIVDNGNAPTSVQKTGDGTLNLQAQNSYTGPTSVVGGTLHVASGASLSDKSHVAVASGATLENEGTVGYVVNNGTAVITGKTDGLSNSGGTATLKGGGQSSSAYNTGTLNIDNASVTGKVEQKAGVLNLSGNAFIGGPLQVDGGQDTGNRFTVGDKGTATIGQLQGEGPGYLGKDASLILSGNGSAYNGSLSGQGKLVINGQNNTLMGTSDYAGGTEIGSGASATVGPQSLGKGTVNIAGADTGANKPVGSLTVHEDGRGDLANNLTGSGLFNKTGNGAVTLLKTADDSQFTGTTNVKQGELEVNTTLGGTLNVDKGAIVSGSGTISNVKLDPNAYLGVTLEGAKGVITPLTLTGKNNQLNGAQVGVTVHNFSEVALGKQYQTTVLRLADQAEATGTLAKTPKALNTAFLKGSVFEAPDNRSWLMSYTRVVPFESYAQTHNEHQVATALDRAAEAGAGPAFMTALLGPAMQTGAQVRGAYNALSGEIHGSAKTAMVNDSFYVQEVVVDRLDCAGDALRAHAHDGKQQTSGYCDVDPAHHVSVWGTVYGQRGGQSGSSAGAAHMGQSSVGWIMGADTGLKGGWRVGGLLAYGRDWFSVQSGRASSSHSNSATIGAYAGNAWHVGGLIDNAAVTFKTGVSYSWNMLHTNRRLSYGDYSGRLSSDNRTGTGQAFVESGYRMVFSSGSQSPLEVEPFARMTYVNYGQDGYREHGADASLRVKGQNSSIGFSTVGVKLATNVGIGKLIFSPHLEAGYRRAFGRTNAMVREGFTSLGDGYGMAVQGTPLSTNTAQINTGFAAHLTDRIDVNLDYIGQYGGRQTSSGGSGSFRYKF
ncbi:autotransporter domain-containing protein [Bombella pollinis]|uniref:Autotransporter domain-containing protein n=1 Tax=Bombella pollinis TaxID=2967337 RepID=A0ABT3WKC9_9PROT|nr:autotransporter domain-containing protein [Bombella pollinis]MCX5619554.1 autotransporter domain-containing protein [Bombella pollinis]